MGFAMRRQVSAAAPARRQSDLLLWLAGAVVAGIAVTWFLISMFGSTDTTAPVVTAPTVASPAPSVKPPEPPAAVGTATRAAGLADPLKVADLALEAGMLIEPEDYSAWTLYGAVLEAEPDNEAARLGLGKVADALLPRAEAALEQGRFDDARAIVARILGTLPEHADALALAERIEASIPKPPPPVAAAAPKIERVRDPKPAPPPVVVPEVAEPEIDRGRQEYDAFELAMSENRLLTPADDSARYHVETMMALHPEHELTAQAQRILTTELLRRSDQALETLDTDAARTWIDEAARVSYDAAAVTDARRRLDDRLIEVESSKPLPASALTLAEYVAPEYPRLALTREVEGWVDLRFTVATDGTTRDIRISDSSPRNLFDREAVTAVERWRFEPRQFMGRTIEQSTYTTIRFTLSD